MSKIHINDLPELDFSEHLDTDESIAEYLAAILEDNDASLLAAALGDIAKARGMADIAKASGMTREALYKALRPNAKPRFETISRVCGALGLKLAITKIPQGDHSTPALR
jgi:probable addiction module antidote protein